MSEEDRTPVTKLTNATKNVIRTAKRSTGNADNVDEVETDSQNKG
jgi:hypothetical protein